MEASFRPVSFLFLAFLFLPNFLFFFFCAGLSELRCIDTERQALLNFKQDLIDPSNRLSSWTAHGDCCLWEGVVCHNLTGHVHELHLRTFYPEGDFVTDEQYEAYWRSMLGDLSDNHFQGPIPVDLQNMTSLSHLDLSWNNFNSSIPNWLYSFSRLEFLNLGGNNLQGTISSAIGNLTSAVSIRIDLPSNRLNQEVSKILEILSSYVGNKLCGPPLTVNCTTNGVKPNNENMSSKETGGLEVDWFYVSMALGFVVGFWSVCGPLLLNKQWRIMYFQFLDHMWYKLKGVVSF
ncbi:hypothetical protein CMV_023446 [Castanea mollissima]|uniref:Leucine-rich repeat-containing N-terminal plant-type domain-containing protein n=1 Tax=Castanea mollissima TaxID=60419 RepID=A0A8J4QQC7_9ROSI|nr:hypothetical protein CMV_023446 [Castanea mollissima]